MSQEIKQQLSAFIDGELDGSSGRFLLRRLQRETELIDCWARWHLARDCMQRQRVTPLRDDFATRIMAAIDAEARPVRSGGAVLRWAGGLAVAASVAFVALLALPSQTGAPNIVPDSAVASAPPAAPAAAEPIGAGAVVAPSGIDSGMLQPSLGGVAQTVSARSSAPSAPVRLDPRIEAYLLQHNGVRLDAGQRVFAPFIPIATPPRPWTMVPPAEGESAR